MRSNGEEMREKGKLAVEHDEHEGLLTVGAKERAGGWCEHRVCCWDGTYVHSHRLPVLPE